MGPAPGGAIALWAQGARPQTLILSMSPIAVGAAYAIATCGPIEPAPIAAAILSAASIQIVANLANDSADGGRGADNEGRVGPPRLVGSGRMSAARVRRGAVFATIVAALSGLVVIAYGGAPILALGLVSILAAWGYSYGPAPISASPFGEAVVVLFFGIGATAGVVWLVARHIDATAVLLGVAVGLPAAAALTVNNHRDRVQDMASGRRTLAILLGPTATTRLYALELISAAATAAFALWPISRAATGFAVCALAVALHLGRRMARTPVSRAMNARLGATVRFQAAFSLAIVVMLLAAAR